MFFNFFLEQLNHFFAIATAGFSLSAATFLKKNLRVQYSPHLFVPLTLNQNVIKIKSVWWLRWHEIIPRHTDCLTLQALFYRSTELKAKQLKERHTFPRSICRYSSLSLLSFGLPHQALGPLRRAYLGSHSLLSVDEAVICLSAMIPVDIPRERTQSGEWEKIAPDNFTHYYASIQHDISVLC